MQNLINSVEAAHRRKNLPTFRVGDVLRVHTRIREGGKERIQVFEGLVIAMKHGTGLSGTFTVRRIASGVGVERVFPLHDPLIAKIERVRSSKVRRAKLYFLRGRVGKKAKLKGWEAYASWSEEPEAPEIPTEASGEETPDDTNSSDTVSDGKGDEASDTPSEDEEQVEDVTAPEADSAPAEATTEAVQSDSGVDETPAKLSPLEEGGDDASPADNGEDRGESGGGTPSQEGSQDSGEKPQE